RSSIQNSCGRQHGGGKVGRAQQCAAHFLQHDTKLDAAKTLAAVGLGHMDAGKAHLLVQLLPGLALPALFGLHQAADFGRGRACGEKAAENVAEIPLLIGESELHRAFLPAPLSLVHVPEKWIPVFPEKDMRNSSRWIVLARLVGRATRSNRMASPPA